MSQNSYGSPTVFLNGKELSYTKITFNDSGNNQATTLTVTSQEIDLSQHKLFDSEIVFYLNAGTHDNIPFFRGRIRDVNPSDTKITLKAIDALGLLAGQHSIRIKFSDSNNYDGYSLTSFLIDYITKNINKNETIIGLDYINELNPSVTLSNYRGEKTPLQVVAENIKLNSSDLNSIQNFKIGVIDDGTKSQLIFRNEQNLSNSSVMFNYNDGIKSVSLKERNPPNIIAGKVDGISKVYQHNSLSTGPNVKNFKRTRPFKDPDDFRKSAFILATKEEKRLELSINVDKGYYLDVGNVIFVSTPDFPNLTGKHRITGKTLTISKGITCSFKLDREIPTIKKYLADSEVETIPI